MSHEPPASVDFISGLLLRKSIEYQEAFSSNNDIDVLTTRAKYIIQRNTEALREATERCHLDVLLSAMFEHAPHPQGRRYVAAVLCAASERGPRTVVEVAIAWMDVFFRIMALLMKMHPQPESPENSNSLHDEHDTFQKELRDVKERIARRERHMCAISGYFDVDYSEHLRETSREHEIPHDISLAPVDLVHILPFSLEALTGNPTDQNIEVRETAVLQAWTGIDIKKLAASKMNTPANAIFVTRGHNYNFRNFYCYLEEIEGSNNCNKYKAYAIRKGLNLFDRRDEAEVVFHSSDAENNPIDPPDPELLKIHAAFAKVLFLSGACRYYRDVKSYGDDYDTLDPNGGADIGLFIDTQLSTKR